LNNRIKTTNNRNFLSPIHPGSANFQKIAVRSSPELAKIGFSPDPVRSSPDPCSYLTYWRCKNRHVTLKTLNNTVLVTRIFQVASQNFPRKIWSNDEM